MSNQLANFNARLDRIQNEKNIAWTDPETGINVPRRLSRLSINKVHTKSKKITVFAMIVSVALGMLCLLAGSFARFHFAGIEFASGYSADMVMGADILAGFIFAVVFGSMIGHAKGKLQVAQVIGILAMAVSMHNLVWAFPDKAERVYGPAFVAEVMSETVPNSLYVRGQVIAL